MQQTRILLVEDDQAQAELLAGFLLERHYDVTVTSNGEAALSFGGHPDFILLDLNLPDWDGTLLCPKLKKLFPRAFIVMLTARKEEIDRVIGLELGADDYVTKPYSLREVDARIRAIIRRHQTLGPATPRPDSTCLKLDADRCLALFAGKEVVLTAQEFRVLDPLVRAPKRIFSRNQLIELAWEEGLFVTDRVVDAMVARIRKKLRHTFGDGFIVTKHGMGYSYEYES